MIEILTKTLNDFFIKIYEWVRKRWFIVSFLLTTSSFWFSLVLSFWGEELHFIVINENKKQFTRLGFLLTMVVIIISFVIQMAQRCYENSKLNPDENKRKMDFLEKVNEETVFICGCKFGTLKREILKIKNDKIKDFPKIISIPSNQLKYILETMIECLCELLSTREYSIQKKDMYISLFYNFPLENDSWEQLVTSLPEKGLSIEELLKEGTTFYRLLKTRKKFLFFNNKEEAKKTNNYIPDEEDIIDENGDLKGSIACYKVVIKEQNKTLIQAVLSISTYNKRFINNNDKKKIEYIESVIREYIINPFMIRINIELCLLYLSILYDKNG